MLLLCLNLGRTSTSHCRRKTKSASKWLDFLVNVPFWSALDLTLNQRVRSSSLPRFAKTLTLPQLCQNYWYLSVRIGEIEVRTPPLNA